MRTLCCWLVLLLWLPPALSDEPLDLVVTKHATGRQLVRVSIPWPERADPNTPWAARPEKGQSIPVALRVVSQHLEADGRQTPRRVLISFPYSFEADSPCRFRLERTAAPAPSFQAAAPASPGMPQIACDGATLSIRWPQGATLHATLIAPSTPTHLPLRIVTVETNQVFQWTSFASDDPKWPRVIEVRRDLLGRVTVIGHVQRRDGLEDGFAPPLGWSLTGDGTLDRVATLATNEPGTTGESPLAAASLSRHSFTTGLPARVLVGSNAWVVDFPTASWKRRGYLEIQPNSPGGWRCDYLRVADGERVPMQPWAWHRFEFSVAPAGRALLTPTLEEPCQAEIPAAEWKRLYGLTAAPELPASSPLAGLLRYQHQAINRSAAMGDDWGNVTGYSDASPHGYTQGMNRLNHATPIFEEAWRAGDASLRRTALLWCENFVDQSIWWGPKATGGTRYNNVKGLNRKALTEDYMWRSNESVHFCTKGYDAFWLAYEETGDPRFLHALEAQVAYAAEHLHVDRGEARNVGDVRDFMRLYTWTGQSRYLDEALRLFRELRSKLAANGLFSQSGAPLEAHLPFINDDAVGYAHPFAKPYIIGYALAGLPDLARGQPDEPRLREVIAAVSDFLADSQDPAGAWRYPHPRSASAIASQAVEHAWQIVQADELLGPSARHLDAIERVLRQRLHFWLATGKILYGFGDWELTTGWVTNQNQLHQLYPRPDDRDSTRDYAEGKITLGSCPPEGLVYFTDVLSFYLQHRPLDRLTVPPAPGTPLYRLLASLPAADRRAGQPERPVQEHGITNGLPVFSDLLARRLTFPQSWLSGHFTNFADWRTETRAVVMKHLLTVPPPAPFAPRVISEIDRGSYFARKVELNLTADSRVLGYLTQPKGPGPFPAVLLLHDHGAKFDIGKEKVIEPWDVPAARLESARAWVKRYYGGRFIGDELARRGYVCFSTDALNWGDRGGAGFEGQQALAANLLHLGGSLAGMIAHEDLRAAEFLATQPMVDSHRVAAMGLSMGSFRTWQVTALSEHIRAGLAICWMATVKGLMVAGNNQTGGQSSYCMTHPGLFNLLDYADVASLACPKPLLVYNGERDALFPVPSVLEAHEKLRRVYASQGATNRLELRLWDAPHAFNLEMQEAAWTWLDRWARPPAPAPAAAQP